MVLFTPHSYVFNGLEIIRDSLIPFIGKILRKNNNKSWWFVYIYNKLAKEHKHITRSGNLKDLYVQLDELLCLKIIRKNKNIFKEHININLVEDVYNIRTTCAHIFLNRGTMEKTDADAALNKMANLIEKIDKENRGRILELKNQMNFQISDRKPVKASRESLISFLNEKIWEPSFELLDKANTLDINEKEKIKNGMKQAMKDLEKNSTNEDVLNWFKYHIYSKEGIKTYNRLKNIKEIDIPTFEDIRLEFLELCYGEL